MGSSLTSRFSSEKDADEVLTRVVFPALLAHRVVGMPLRIWVAGCGTGEVTYSLAIALLEFFAQERGYDAPELDPRPVFQILSSDAHADALAQAREGFYPEDAFALVHPLLRERYFTEERGIPRVRKFIRDLCVFVLHDLEEDPPFSRLDLVDCRALSRLLPTRRQHMVPLLQQCLRTPGFLLLGTAPTETPLEPFFVPVAEHHGVFARAVTEAVAVDRANQALTTTIEELITLNEELHLRNREAVSIGTDLANLMSAIDVAVIIVTRDGRIRRFTPRARLVMNLAATDIGKHIDRLQPHIDVPQLEAWIEETLTTLEMREVELIDRKGRWTRVQIRPYLSSEHHVDGAIISFVDIDELKRALEFSESARSVADAARQTAVDSDHAKDEFLATLSHELRTPLSAIAMSANILRRGDVNDEAALRIAGRIERSATLQGHIIDDLLDVARIVAGKLELRWEDVDLEEIVRCSVDAVRPLAEAKGLTLEVDIACAIEPIRGDAGRLAQAMSNLLGNAMKFTAQGGHVLVVLLAEALHCEIRVIDNGVGIAPEFIPSVFERFSQADRFAGRRSSGLGLGLSIVRSLVEAHRGEVHAESAGLGLGTTLRLRLRLRTPSLPRHLSPAGERRLVARG